MEVPQLVEKLWKDYTADLKQSKVVDEWYSRMTIQYNNENRKYHNFSHLETKLQHFLSIQSKIKNKIAFVLALYFQ